MGVMLDNLIFTQGYRCFFCDKHLPQERASVEHLLAKSKGGNDAEENLVACCKTINGILGNRSVKEKFAIVLKQKGSFRCPEDSKPVPPATPQQPDALYLKTVEWLRKQGKARPQKRDGLKNSLNNLLKNSQADVNGIIQQLEKNRKISFTNDKVNYSL